MGLGPGDKLMTVLEKVYGFATEVPFGGLDGTRAWRWDAAHRCGVCVEYQGQGFGHHTAKGMARDARKISEGQLAGLTVIVCTSATVDDGSCIELIERALHNTPEGSAALAEAWETGAWLRAD